MRQAKVSSRALNTKSFIVFDIFERAYEMRLQGRRPILLAVGEPDFPTPEEIIEACDKAMRDGHTRYTHSLGIIQLREAISADYKKRYNVDIDPGCIMVCSGTSPAMWMLFGALLEYGDEVIVSDPCYPCYPNFIRYMGGEVVWVRVKEEEGFVYLPQDIAPKITERTAGIMINSPGNPTGILISPKRMAEIAQLGPPIISDEIYHGLVYEGSAHSILEFTKNAFVLNGFSKRYAMTGWRVGYLIAPPHFMRPLQNVQQNFQISVNTFAQYGALEALTNPAVERKVAEMVKIFDERRRYMVNRLKKMGFGIAVEPTGAFYVFANAKKFTNDTYSFAFDCLEKAEVGVTPGIDFGPGGEGFIRFSYANSMENIEEGLDRLEKYLAMIGEKN